jgi:hypothetical protein
VPQRRSIATAVQILISHAFGDASGPWIVGAISDWVFGIFELIYTYQLKIRYVKKYDFIICKGSWPGSESEGSFQFADGCLLFAQYSASNQWNCLLGIRFHTSSCNSTN